MPDAKTTVCGRELGHPLTYTEFQPNDSTRCSRCERSMVQPVQVWARWPIKQYRRWSLWHAVERDRY